MAANIRRRIGRHEVRRHVGRRRRRHRPPDRHRPARPRPVDVPPVVVVSATSKTTDQLLALAADAQRRPDGREPRRRSRARAAPRDRPRADHGRARGRARSPQIRRELEDLRAVLTAIAILRESSPRSLDAVAAVGEIVSSRIVAAAFEEAGVPAAWVDARRALVTDDQHTAALPLALETRGGGRARARAAPRWPGACRCSAGFVGSTVVRRHHDARPRRLGLLGGADGRGAARADRRRRARRWRAARSRSGPTSTAC